jgi:hypothetical protein
MDLQYKQEMSLNYGIYGTDDPRHKAMMNGIKSRLDSRNAKRMFYHDHKIDLSNGVPRARADGSSDRRVENDRY